MRRDLEPRGYPSVRRGSDWEPFSSLAPLASVGDLFQSFFSPAFLGSPIGSNLPALDLTEVDDHYKLMVDVPGYTMDQIDVQLADNVLTISGQQAEKVTETGGDGKKERNESFHIVERTRGAFTRSIKFPVPVDAAGVKATLKNGVLTITVPKGAASRAQKVKIAAG